MTALDTNVLVRIITNDDRAQAARAAAFLLAQERVFVPKTVMLELEWVLRSAYRSEPSAVVSAFREIMKVSNVEIEDEAAVTQAIEWHERGMDFADALHVASAGSALKFATFDNRLRGRLRRMGVVESAHI
jgi:predicted nucleic-acid-binding protein